MTESNAARGSDDRTDGDGPSQRNLVNIIYILYLANLIFGITAVIGVIMAYVNRGDAPAWLCTHYTFQIRTFWIGLLYFAIGAVTAVIGIGFLLILIWYVWLIVRCAKGMKHLSRAEAHPDEMNWAFG